MHKEGRNAGEEFPVNLDYVWPLVYNRKRRHSALGYKTIDEFVKINNNFKNAA
jgi:hypothetical protein